MNQRELTYKMHNEGKSFNEIQKELQIMFGQSAYKRSAIYNHIKIAKLNISPNQHNINAENFSNSIDEQLMKRIQEIIRDEPYSSIRDISKVLNESKSTVYRYLKCHIGMVYKYTRWLPHKLTDDNKTLKAVQSSELSMILKASKVNSYRNIITGDESWFMYKYFCNGKWVMESDENPIADGSKINIKKVMITIMWGVWGFYTVDVLPNGKTYTSEYFVDNIVKKLDQNKQQIWPGRGRHLINLHLDNASVHNSAYTQNELDQTIFKRTPHPPYSPDLAPSDFFLFGYIKNKLKGHSYNDLIELYEAIIEILSKIPHKTLIKVFEEWISRCDLVSTYFGEYYYKD